MAGWRCGCALFGRAAALAWMVGGVGAGAARADAPTARLRYETEAAGEPCPPEQSVRDLVVARIGRDPFAEDAAHEVRATVALAADRGSLIGRVEIAGADGTGLGERSLGAPRGECRELVHAMVVSIGIALDPATSPIPTESVAEPRLDTPPEPVAPAAAPEPVERPPPVALHGAPPAPAVALAEEGAPLELGIGARARVGVTPGVALGGAIGASWRRPSRRLGGSLGVEVGAVALPAAVSLAGVPTGVTVIAGAIVPCLSRSALAGCLVVAGGVFEARGALDQAVARSPWAETGARLRWDLALSRGLALRAEIEASILWIVPIIRVDGLPAWTAGPLAGAASLGLVVFP